ncbi:hypothetical protein [Arthrobacter parietis]|uniref:hypothetical protein n=1 Tax=Arthrobacter parietis TaxID=271434 RepID=UPI0031F73B23
MIIDLFRWAIADIKSKKNLDVWILFALALSFALLGILGLDAKFLSPIVLSLLGVLALSQIRSRDQIAEITASWRRSRTSIFSHDFPEQYYDARSKASSNYFFAGMTMRRTLPTMERDLTRILENGGKVRIILPNPNDENLLQMIAASRNNTSATRIRKSIEETLDSARHLHSKIGGNMEIRTTSVLPRVGINALDLGMPSASIMVQLYGHKPTSESKPIFYLTPSDKEWFTHFAEEVEKIWASGTDPA